jgi:hypothetical protein
VGQYPFNSSDLLITRQLPTISSSNVGDLRIDEGFVVQSSMDATSHINDPDTTTVVHDRSRTTAFVENTNVVLTNYPSSPSIDNNGRKVYISKRFPS